MELQYFTLSEFDSPDDPGSGSLMDEHFLATLEEIRRICNFPFIINSGFRTIRHNIAVGGKPNSAHLRGLAADISITDSSKRFTILSVALYLGIKRIEIAKTWIHLDIDPTLLQSVAMLA